MEIRFSIIVPVCNVESYLGRCVESLVNQEKMEDQLEILLIDDGSVDNSGMLCDKMKEQFPQIRVFHKEHGGPSSARNVGIKSARGKYILFVDSDDFIESCTCFKLNQVLKKYNNVDMVIFNGIKEQGDVQNSVKRIPAESIRLSQNGRLFLTEHYQSRNLNIEVWLYAYKREFLLKKELSFQEGILHEDVEFIPRVLLECNEILEIPDFFYHYVVRENSISTQKNREKNIKDLTLVLKQQVQIAEQQEPELKKWMKNAILNSYLNMIQDSRMYQKQYRGLLDKHFLLGKAATAWNRMRVIICLINVRWYCMMNDLYKKVRSGRQKYE